MSTQKIMVVHAGRRDRYELAKAFEGENTYLVTDFYYNPRRISGKVARFLFGDGVLRRYRADLDVRVRGSLFLFVLDLLERVWPRNTIIYRLRAYGLARLALRTAQRHSITHAIVYYNSGASWLFKRLNKSCRKILFQMHPHPARIIRIYEDYLAERPMLRVDLASEEEELSVQKQYVDTLSQEALAADSVFCTTTFVADSLIEGGVALDSTIVCPYGTAAVNDTAEPETRTGLNLAFVGQFIVRKGVYELVEAITNRPEDTLTIFTRDRARAVSQIKKWFGYRPDNITIEEVFDNDILWQKASAKDFLILPSLVEGFGLVLIEALSHGLPVITTVNTAGPDLLKSSEAGILLKGFMSWDIVEGLDRALEVRHEWPRLRQNALATARAQTWERFRKELRNAIK